MKNIFSDFNFKKAVWIAPILYAIHLFEETITGFYLWMNKVRGMNFSVVDFLLVNSMLMLFYLALLTTFTLRPKRSIGLLVLAWLITAQFANWIHHLFANAVYGMYPGVITSTVLYAPYIPILYWIAYRDEILPNKIFGIIFFPAMTILASIFEITVLLGYPLFG